MNKTTAICLSIFAISMFLLSQVMIIVSYSNSGNFTLLNSFVTMVNIIGILWNGKMIAEHIATKG